MRSMLEDSTTYAKLDVDNTETLVKQNNRLVKKLLTRKVIDNNEEDNNQHYHLKYMVCLKFTKKTYLSGQKFPKSKSRDTHFPNSLITS